MDKASDPVRSVRWLTARCIAKFENLLNPLSPRRTERLEPRLADFNLWADGVGAMAKPGASLDSRLQGRTNDLALVRNVLSILGDSLDYFGHLPEKHPKFDDALKNVDSAIKNLALIGASIRRTGKASRNRRADRTFNPDEHQEFRRHLECVMLLRPTEAGRKAGADMDASRLPDLQRRLIEANLRRRHAFLLAQKGSRTREVVQTQTQALTPAASLSTDTPLKEEGGRVVTQPAADSQGKTTAAPTISGFSLASTAEGTLQYAPAGRRYAPGVVRTQITAIAADAEFPHAPSIPEGREISTCPCCCQSLPVETFINPNTWKQHVIEDLCPYTCIADNCPTPRLLFCTRSEWEMHVKQSHPAKWQCPFCDDRDENYPTMESIGDHIQAHHTQELQDNSISALLSWSAMQRIGIQTCPLCSSRGPEDSPELVDHVLRHTYEFALRALPWPQPVVHDLNLPPGTFNPPADAENTGLQQWLDQATHESVGPPRLELCKYDGKDHSFPEPSTNLFEYTDYFLANGYFEASPEDKSSRLQGDRTITSELDDDQSSEVSWGPQADEMTSSRVRHPVRLASASTFIGIKIWDPATGQCIATLDDDDDAIRAVAWSSDASRLAAASNTGKVKILDPATSGIISRLEGHASPATAVSWSPDATQLASGSEDMTVKIWDAATGLCRATLEGHKFTVSSVAWSPNTAWVASGSIDYTLKIWDSATGQRVTTLKGHNDMVHSVAWSPDGAQLASLGGDNAVKIWDPTTGQCIALLKGFIIGGSLAWSPDASRLAFTTDKDIEIWDMAASSSEPLAKLQGHSSFVNSVDWSPDGTQLASGSSDKTVKIWDPATGQCVTTLGEGSRYEVLAVAWSPM